jgi:hypothetical protein
VVLNVGAADQELALSIQNYQIVGGEIIRTSETEQGETVGSFDQSTNLNLPSRSITTVVISGQQVDGVEALKSLPESPVLHQNHPNPFNPTTEIRYRIPVKTKVRLSVFNMQGSLVTRLVDQIQNAGEHRALWDGRNLPSGTYFYRLQAGRYSRARKMTLIK